MHDQLIGYLLDALDREEALHVEGMLEADVEVRRQLEVFRKGLTPLAGDQQFLQVPPGLAARTCRLIYQVNSGE